MASHTATPPFDGYQLEPLHGLQLLPPFVDDHDLDQTPRATGGDVTPLLVRADMYSPARRLTDYSVPCRMISTPKGIVPSEPWNVLPPATPMLKDMDSFTEGTHMGSFDFIMDDAPSHEAHFFHPTLSLNRASDSIEMWRDDVSRNMDTDHEHDPSPNPHDHAALPHARPRALKHSVSATLGGAGGVDVAPARQRRFECVHDSLLLGIPVTVIPRQSTWDLYELARGPSSRSAYRFSESRPARKHRSFSAPPRSGIASF
ncbi:hypothetical protein PLICRDRAFT_651871 [Plicaturopsis crispa FD-325 SS-3]|nr:hypothetical protein PLICRDRAFT_651871 [Plicaturopsis crispa FD-325 SS-3]